MYKRVNIYIFLNFLRDFVSKKKNVMTTVGYSMRRNRRRQDRMQKD